MLSILIPTYNYNVFNLVSTIHKQCKALAIAFEIVVYDDGSQNFHVENNAINSLTNCSYTILKHNIGRSAIRNLLAKSAIYENLLFLDADVSCISTEFIKNYITLITKNQNYEVVYGGIVYQTNKPENEQLLRWVYGINREALDFNVRNKNPHLSFLTLNFLIKKCVFSKVQFNEVIPNLRYEDLLFSYHLKKENVNVLHLNNPVKHDGIETSEVFLKKTNESLVGLKYLTDHQLIDPNYAKITRVYQLVQKYKLATFLKFVHKTTQIAFKKHLLGSNPSLFVYDLYRLGYFISL